MQKVMIVEDDVEINKLLTDFLNKNGYEVFCQYDGLHVLDCLLENKIDLLLMDIMLPYRSGDIMDGTVDSTHSAEVLQYAAEIIVSFSQMHSPGN